MNKPALEAAVASFATAQQKRIGSIENLGQEMEKVMLGTSTLPSVTRAVLIELGDRYQANKESGVCL